MTQAATPPHDVMDPRGGAAVTAVAEKAQDESNEKKVALIVSTLRDRLHTPVDDDTLTEFVRADFTRYEQARIRDFIPVLVERDVRERLLRRPTTSRL